MLGNRTNLSYSIQLYNAVMCADMELMSTMLSYMQAVAGNGCQCATSSVE